MSGVDGYKPVEDDLEPIENLTPLVQSSNPDKAIWDRIPESNLLVSLRWLPFVTTGISVFGMYALKYLISPPSPRTLLRRRIALAVYCAHTSYSCYYALSFAKEASLRHNKAYHDDFGGLSPMWICTERLILYSGEVRKAIETINTNVAREDLESRRGQYDKFRELVPAESLSERIFRFTRTWFSKYDHRVVFHDMLAPRLGEVGCSPREIDISISLAAFCIDIDALDPWIHLYSQYAVELGLASQLVIRRPLLIWLSTLASVSGLIGCSTFSHLMRYHLLEEPTTVRRDKWKDIGAVWKEAFNLRLEKD